MPGAGGGQLHEEVHRGPWARFQFRGPDSQIREPSIICAKTQDDQDMFTGEVEEQGCFRDHILVQTTYYAIHT